MDPALTGIFAKAAEQGFTALLLFGAVYVLSKTLKAQYESRISDLEDRSKVCERDRIELGRAIRDMQNARIESQNRRIGILETALAEHSLNLAPEES